jgi:hypothetical protein
VTSPGPDCHVPGLVSFSLHVLNGVMKIEEMEEMEGQWWVGEGIHTETKRGDLGAGVELENSL